MNTDRLDELLNAGRWIEADLETQRLLTKAIVHQGNCQGLRQFLVNGPMLQDIDSKWVKYSFGRFGFSVQSKIFKSILKRDYSLDSAVRDKEYFEALIAKKAKSRVSDESKALSSIFLSATRVYDHLDMLFRDGKIDDICQVLCPLVREDITAKSSNMPLVEALAAYKAFRKVLSKQTEASRELWATINYEVNKHCLATYKSFLYSMGWLQRREVRLRPSRIVSGLLRNFQLQNVAELLDSAKSLPVVNLYSEYSKELVNHGDLSFSLTAPDGHLPAAFVYKLIEVNFNGPSHYLKDDIILDLENFYWLLDLGLPSTHK